jgi:hypothetical protein
MPSDYWAIEADLGTGWKPRGQISIVEINQSHDKINAITDCHATGAGPPSACDQRGAAGWLAAARRRYGARAR